MITVAWYDYRPGQVTPERRRAFVAALQKLLPGATVTYKTHIDDGDWSGAGGNAALEKVAMNIAVSNASPAALAQALNTIRTRPGGIWPVPQVRRRALWACGHVGLQACLSQVPCCCSPPTSRCHSWCPRSLARWRLRMGMACAGCPTPTLCRPATVCGGACLQRAQALSGVP
jgi:hypothetical protein